MQSQKEPKIRTPSMHHAEPVGISHNIIQSYSITRFVSIIYIAINLPGHDHHPEKEDGIDQLKRKRCFPAITYVGSSVISRQS
jgi:hypothetical protein